MADDQYSGSASSVAICQFASTAHYFKLAQPILHLSVRQDTASVNL